MMYMHMVICSCHCLTEVNFQHCAIIPYMEQEILLPKKADGVCFTVQTAASVLLRVVGQGMKTY